MPGSRTTGRSSRARFRKTRRRRAASSIQAAWRQRQKQKRGSLVSRTALANRKAIKAIKRNQELKFVNNAQCSTRTNYIGQILTNTKVDNYGMSQSSADWVLAGGAATSLPTVSKYCPLIINPIVVPQAGTLIQTGGPADGPTVTASENARIGNDIIMSHITFKIAMSGSVAQTNGGNYQNCVQKQTVWAMLMLDRQPAKQPPSLTTSAPVFTSNKISCQLYPQTPDGVLALPALPDSSKEYVRSLPAKTANPPGIQTGNVGQRDLSCLSFASKDYVIGKSGRFQILKKVKLSCYQRSGGAGAENFNGSSVPTCAYTSFTQKGNYKFHFGADNFVIPDNQTLLLALYSDTPTNRSAGGAVPTSYVAPPTVSVLTRFSFRDS